MISLSLYSSESCCLCDDAYELLTQSEYFTTLSVEKVDIYTDKSLLVKYRIAIPVLKDAQTQRELRWPFDLETLNDWLNEISG